MSCSGQSNCDCGCCAGTSVQTPQAETNSPGLSSIAYRAGNWSSFKESMLARLSSLDYPALAALKTRSDDDFTVAFIDATAVVLDILTFYQERLANESYLRTAGQLRSLTELSRLIGYQPAAGVSAATYLAFTMRQAPGSVPDPSAPAIVIPQGTQVQSVPVQGQKPQTFETSADITAKPDWVALTVQSTLPWTPELGDFGVYLDGTATQLLPGDLILIVGDERLGNPADNHWDIRVVSLLKVDSVNQRTWVAWSEALGHGSVTPAQLNPKFFAFRQRAALFGYNSMDPHLLDQKHINLPSGSLASNGDWNFQIVDLAGSSLIDLDAAYPKIVPGGWIALILPDSQTTRSPAGEVGLYQVSGVTTVSRTNFATSAKISRAAVDTNTQLSNCYNNTRATSALAQSEQLAAASQPLNYPLYGRFVDLDTLRPDLAGLSVVAIFGKRQKLAVHAGVTGLSFIPDDGTTPVSLAPGDVVTLTQPSPLPPPSNEGVFPSWAVASASVSLYVEDVNGRTGTVTASLDDFALAASDPNDPMVSEFALVDSINTPQSPAPRTQLKLISDLEYCYERSTATVNANVGLATNGQSVTDILGNGSASTPNQTFTLKQSPLTFIQAPTPTGRLSTLQVKVNSVPWTEVPSLYAQGPSAPEFATLNQADGTTDVLFGDGVEGAILPTGQNNIQASYRIGSGSVGNVDAGALTTLVDRPLGVSGVTNPAAATGGQDAQTVDDIRSCAPQTVLTLGRAVSIMDYQSYASTFAGIAKAYAIWIPSGPGRGVFLTVAGVDGVALPPGNFTLNNLAASLQNYGNPLIPITVLSFLETLFSISADLKYDPSLDSSAIGAVESSVRQALAEAFSFAARTFGQGVSADEICGVIQAVPGIVAVNVTNLEPVATSTAGDLSSQAGHLTVTALNNWMSQQVVLPRPFSDSSSRICAYLPVASPLSLPQPAEILVLHPDPAQVILGVMS